MRKKRVHIFLEPKLIEFLRQRAVELHIDPSVLLRKILWTYFESPEEGEQQ